MYECCIQPRTIINCVKSITQGSYRHFNVVFQRLFRVKKQNSVVVKESSDAFSVTLQVQYLYIYHLQDIVSNTKNTGHYLLSHH